MSALIATHADASGGDTLRALRVALIVDPATANAMPPAQPPGVNLHLHLISLEAFDSALPFLRQADVLILEVPPGGPETLEAFTRIAGEQNRPVIAAARAVDAGMMRALMRAGAVDVVGLPLDTQELDDSLLTARTAMERRPQMAAKGRVISFMRAVGGAGATALACQLGCLWAARQTVCLIDLDIQFGTAALYLDLQPTLGLLDLVDAGERLDHTLFETIAARHSSGLRVIAAPPEMVPLETLAPDFVAQILALAAQSFEVVLVDLPSAWTGWSMAALSHSDAACLVTNLSVPGLRQARRQLDVIDANSVSVPVQIALNRVPKKIFRTIDLGDSEKALRRKVDFTIADDAPTMNSAIDQGRAIGAVRAKSPIEADLVKLMSGLTALVAA